MLRPVAPTDRPDLIALALAEDAAWSGGPAVSAEEAGEFVDGYRSAPGVVVEREGRVVGYAAVRAGGKTLVLVEPGEAVPVLEALVAWLTERGHREVITYARDAQRVAWLEANGFAHRSSSFDLLRRAAPPPAPPAWPSGIEVARYVRGPDDHAVHGLVYRDAGWGEVPGHEDSSLEAWQATISEHYRGWVARRAGRPVGWAAGRVFDDGRGWIEQLAVARADRGQGLGRALLLHTVGDLLARGATALALGVHGENENAIRLYRDVGFEVACEWRVYERPDAPRAGLV